MRVQATAAGYIECLGGVLGLMAMGHIRCHPMAELRAVDATLRWVYCKGQIERSTKWVLSMGGKAHEEETQRTAASAVTKRRRSNVPLGGYYKYYSLAATMTRDVVNVEENDKKEASE
jgi:hypothetical protein